MKEEKSNNSLYSQGYWSGLARTRATLKGTTKAFTKIFKNGNSQAVRIPAELGYSAWDIDLVIERHGDELHIKPVQRRMGNVLEKLNKFSPNFMSNV
jgi:antitoxin VapB